ncbi:MAG: hypothetical protein CMJ83_20600 [Planctomycetes bacterium]|nr:hypothetical protein [Planctomycetota bacterium]
MRRISTWTLLVAAVLNAAALATAQDGGPAATAAEPTYRLIDFAAIDRSIKKLPTFLSSEQRYGLLLFGRNGETRMWAVMDRSDPKRAPFDVLYLDLDADGDLTEAGERFQGDTTSVGRVNFLIPILVDPATKAEHTEVSINWRPKSDRLPEGTRFKIRWRGGKITMGPYGPYSKCYQPFATTPQDAPVFVPGFDRPFQFQHWMCDKLQRGNATEFKVFVGNRGSRPGSFFCVNDRFLGTKDSPEATLICTDLDGKPLRYHVKLTSRC